MPRDDQADYPGAFVYLCAATGNVDVAEQPLLQAPRGSVKGLVIMRALSGNSDADQRHCIVPAQRLAQIGATGCGLKKHQILYVDGHVDAFAEFAPAIGLAQGLAREAKASILFNITAGRTQCKFGALFGWERDPAVPLQVVSVGFNPFRADILSLDGSGKTVQKILPMARRQSFAGYLKAHQLVESNLVNRNNRTRFSTDAALAAGRLFDALADSTVDNALREVQQSFANNGRALLQRAQPITPNLEVLAQATHDFEGVAGIAIAADRSSLQITEPMACDFLAGQWLEALLFKRLTDKLADLGTTIEVFTGTALAPIGADGPADVGDLDVAVYVGSALYVIETKAGGSAHGANKAIQQLTLFIHRLLGVAGGARGGQAGARRTRPARRTRRSATPRHQRRPLSHGCTGVIRIE